MSFGSKSSKSRNPAITPGSTGTTTTSASNPLPANVPTSANASVLLAGLMGMRPRNAPALSNNYAVGGGSNTALGRRPALAKRTVVGGL